MKKLFLGLLSLSLLLGLTACGSGSSTTSSSPNANSSPSKAESAKASDSAKDPKETYDLTGKRYICSVPPEVAVSSRA